MNLGIENETIEFKKTTGELKEAIISISSMINKHGLATLYFGVNPKGEVLGQDISEETLRKVSQGIAENIEPQIYPVIEKITLDGKSLVKVEANGEEIPYSAFGRYYMRTADEDREITSNELKKMLSFNSNNDLFEKKVSEDRIEDIDNAAIDKFLNKAINSKRLPNENNDKRVLLKKIGLTNGEYLNNAGRILFSSHNPVTLKMAVFASNEKLTFIDQRIIEDNIINLIDIAEGYIFEHMNWKVKITSGPREEIPEIPVACIRELISNFFAHAVYNNNRTYHEIDIHPGFIKIYNPGTFASSHKPEEYATGICESQIRNRLIAKALYLYDRIEQFGSGLNKVITLLETNGIKYEFDNSIYGFSVKIYRESEKEEDNKNQEKELNKTEMITLNLIKNNKYITTKEISNELAVTQRTVMNITKRLTEKGYIERIGNKKGGYWDIKF